MPSLLDPSLLRGSQPGDDPTGIQTLLSSIGSAVSGGVAQPNDPNTSIPALLAAASSMANAGAPTLGPPPTTAQAILGALGAGRNAALQTGILPYMQERAQQQLQMQQLDYEQKLFNFNRQYNYMNLVKQGVAADASGPAPATAPQGAPTANIAQLPDVQALPDQTRVAAIQAMVAANMSPDEAAQYARMLMAESAGQHINPKTGEVTKNDTSGATGVAQVLPETFTDMQKKYGFKGAITDLVPNLTAGANYFHDQVTANNGDLRNGTIAYSMGPTGLADYQAGRRVLPAETEDYLIKTNAPPAPGVQVADSSGRTGGTPRTSAAPSAPAASITDPLVPDLLNPALMVPRSIELAAQGAGRGAADNPMAAHAAVIQHYVEARALAPHVVPGSVPGVQINTTTGQTETAPTGVTSLSPITPAERASMFPQIPKWQDIVVTRDPSGRITDYKLPDMGPEPVTPLSDADAQKPTEQGGAGASYRPQTAYGVGARTGLVKPIQIERGAGTPTPGDGTTGGASVTPGQLSVQQQQFQQAQTLEDQIVHSPVYGQWNQGSQKYDAVITALNQHTRVGDQAAIESLAKVFDPSAVVTEGKLSMSSNYGGIGQVLQNWLGSITGDAGLPDSVRAQIANLATSEMKTRDAAVLAQIQRSRASAQAKGVNPDNVMPLFQTTALGADDPEAKGAPKGVQLAKPYVLQNGQYVRGDAAQPSQSNQNNTAAVPSPAQFSAMTDAGLGTLLGDMKAHPERYGPEYNRAIQTELNARAGRSKTSAAPASGGG